MQDPQETATPGPAITDIVGGEAATALAHWPGFLVVRRV